MTKNKVRVYSLLAIVIFFAGLCALSFKNYYDFLDTKAEFHSKEREIIGLNKQIRMVEASLERFAKEKYEFELYLFKDKDIPAFLDGIARSAEDAEVNITNMKTDRFRQVKTVKALDESQSALEKKRRQKKSEQTAKEAGPQTTLAALPIKIQMEGTFGALMRFLDSIEEFKQLLTISNIKIVSGKDYPLLKCYFVLRIYSTKELKDFES